MDPKATPNDNPRRGAAALHDPETMPGRPLSVLLVEDNAEAGPTLAKALQTLYPAWAVELVTDLAGAMARLGSGGEHFDAAIVDLSLPDADGDGEAAVRLRAIEPTLPVLVLTGNASDRTADRLIRDGVQDYFVKGQATPRQIARSVMTAIERQARQSELEAAALRDRLTGMLNRRGLDLEFARFCRMASRRESQFALILCDLDRLKSVNDRHGHRMGDELLDCFAARLRNGVRPTDIVARVGGDEFVLLLDGVESPSDAASACVRLAAGVAEECRIREQRFRLEASYGLALFPAHGRDLPTLMAKADTAMYRAKRTGVTLVLA